MKGLSSEAPQAICWNVVLNVKTITIILVILSFLSMLTAFGTIIYFSPDSKKLKSILDKIEAEELGNGPMTRLLRNLTNMHLYSSMWIELPKSEKVLQLDGVSELVERMVKSRKIIKYSIGCAILSMSLVVILAML